MWKSNRCEGLRRPDATGTVDDLEKSHEQKPLKASSTWSFESATQVEKWLIRTSFNTYRAFWIVWHQICRCRISWVAELINKADSKTLSKRQNMKNGNLAWVWVLSVSKSGSASWTPTRVKSARTLKPLEHHPLLDQRQDKEGIKSSRMVASNEGFYKVGKSTYLKRRGEERGRKRTVCTEYECSKVRVRRANRHPKFASKPYLGIILLVRIAFLPKHHQQHWPLDVSLTLYARLCFTRTGERGSVNEERWSKGVVILSSFVFSQRGSNFGGRCLTSPEAWFLVNHVSSLASFQLSFASFQMLSIPFSLGVHAQFLFLLKTIGTLLFLRYLKIAIHIAIHYIYLRQCETSMIPSVCLLLFLFAA